MNIEIKYKPGFSMAVLTLSSGEQIRTEAGAMVSKTTNIDMRTEKATRGSILKSLKAAFLGGESFWMNIFSVNSGKGELRLAPTLPGDIELTELKDNTIYVQSTSFLAAETTVVLDTKFQGLKGFISGESLFFLKLSGRGKVLLSSYGGIEKKKVHDAFIVDTGHIVAFEETLNYEIRKFGGWKNFFLGSEGLVARLSGEGHVWIQSRNVPVLGHWLRSVLPPKKK
jgi:uncharacterized protein (TIGR00266 family)